MRSLRWFALLLLGVGTFVWMSTSAVSEEGSGSTAWGPSLVQANGETVSSDVLSGKIVGLYFSAIWCPPCKAFTPLLVDAYNELKAAGKPFEIVFVSHDRNDAAMMQYMTEYNMSWYAVPFDAVEREALKVAHGVRGIPMLIILDEQGNVITQHGRGQVASEGAAAFDRWAAAAQPAY
jgi:nucleoredoxin